MTNKKKATTPVGSGDLLDHTVILIKSLTRQLLDWLAQCRKMRTARNAQSRSTLANGHNDESTGQSITTQPPAHRSTLSESHEMEHPTPAVEKSCRKNPARTVSESRDTTWRPVKSRVEQLRAWQYAVLPNPLPGGITTPPQNNVASTHPMSASQTSGHASECHGKSTPVTPPEGHLQSFPISVDNPCGVVWSNVES